MGTFQLLTPEGPRLLVSIPITYDHRKVCFLGVAQEGADPLLHHQELLPVLFVLCKLVLRWAAELQERDDAVGAMKIRIREVEAGLAGSIDALEPIVGNSPILLREIQTVSQVAPTDLAVLMCGPTGVGKELFARRIHRLSKRAVGPFVPINCASIPENLLESELFGVERGAFTGADRSRKGFFEKAAGGTLFLDEIGDLPLGLQPKLLRVLEEKQIAPLGSTKTRTVDVRVVAATNRNPQEMIAKGQFREDLYYRLAGVLLHVPPLRERGEDVLLLANYFLHVANREFGKKVGGFDERSVHLLRRYAWPGNVRQLQALIKQLVLMSNGPVLDKAQVEAVMARHHPDGLRAPTDTWHLPWEEAWNAFEQEYFRRRLASHHGPVARLAKDVGMTRPNLYLKMKKWGLKPGQN
jgi:transcriptional regulator with PAS, ATPase and Fis domain